jgi:UDP-glucose 4-epimerase
VNRSDLHANRQGSVLIAGAGGFIGRRLVALLRRSGLTVYAPRSADCDLRRLSDTRRLVDGCRPEAIANLARPSHAAETSGHDGHVEIAANLLAAAREAGVRRLIQLGSATEFGEAESPVDDDAPPHPTTAFGEAKARVSSLVLDTDGDGIRTTVLRPFSVYGPGDQQQHLIPAAIDAALSGRSLPVASGVKRDWVFLEDVARGCALALDGRADGLAVNLASGAAVPNERVVELVGEIAGRAVEIERDAMAPRPWDAGVAGSTDRARLSLGWTARTSLAEGIRTTLAANLPSPGTPEVAAAG